MLLEIVSPDNLIFKGNSNLITLPGKNGGFQVLENHASLLSILKKGTVFFKTKDKVDEKQKSTLFAVDDETFSIPISSGIIEFTNNKAVLLIEF